MQDKDVDGGKNYQQSVDACAAMGGRIAILNTKAKYDDAASQVVTGTAYWIGGAWDTNDERWEWVDESRMPANGASTDDNYENWHGSTEPDNPTTEGCVIWTSAKTFRSWACSAPSVVLTVGF